MTTIDFRTMPANVPSLCIPRVFPNIDERRIRGIFDSLNMGEIARVDIISRKTDKGENFNRVFIHWKKWYDSENANQSRERLLNGKEIKIIYDEPWFWKISAYRESVQKQSVPLPIAQGLPRLQFDSDEDKAPVVKNDNRTPRNDARPRNDTRPRNYARPRNDTRPRNDARPRNDTRPFKNTEVKTFEPSTPDSSPHSMDKIPVTEATTDYEDEKHEQQMLSSFVPITLDYGNPLPLKKLIFKPKKPVILEDGEI